MITLALFFLFQPNRNPQHPDIHVRLTVAETIQINHSLTAEAKEKVEMDLIKLHQPAPPPACPSTEGYQGRHEYASELTYSWETPRCFVK